MQTVGEFAFWITSKTPKERRIGSSFPGPCATLASGLTVAVVPIWNPTPAGALVVRDEDRELVLAADLLVGADVADHLGVAHLRGWCSRAYFDVMGERTARACRLPRALLVPMDALE